MNDLTPETIEYQYRAAHVYAQHCQAELRSTLNAYDATDASGIVRIEQEWRSFRDAVTRFQVAEKTWKESRR